jgi:predicted transposase YbfD/YdcC
VIKLLNPEAFEASFRSWTAALDIATKGRAIGLDGKTVRRSHDQALGKAAIHMVSAWAGAGRMVLGQTKVDAKSNEITAIPELLKLIDVSGSIVTIDAMGCQKEIAAEIVRQGADYMLAVKNNQPHLHQDIAALFAGAPLPLHEFTQTAETGHGRREVRYCSVISDPNLLNKIRGKDDWTNLRSVARVTAVRQVSKDKRTIHERLYICSLQADAKEALETVRGHWSIENSQHWVLDVAFREDDVRIRKGNGAENFAVLRRIALNLLKGETKVKAGIKAKRHVAGWDEKYLLGLLLG